MAGGDYSEYEKRRAESHELAWRLAAMLVNIRSRHCRYRLCRRHETCDGPMLPSDHQLGTVRFHKDVGMSGTACANLPMCMANATAERYAYVKGVCEKLKDLREKDYKDDTLGDFLFDLRASMRSQHRQHVAPLTSPAQRPTSGTTHEG
jgi:hypothetical protein